MVVRLSTYAKHRILHLRFQKNTKIIQIARILNEEDNIKVSRESVSAFLKRFNETKSIDDKPRPGRRKKLSNEEIELIGEVTRLNRDITAPKIKECLNLNVSSYTILRASKQFEWNKVNPNSNESKKAAALERDLKDETKRKKRKKIYRSKKIDIKNEQINTEVPNESLNLNLLNEKEIVYIRNISSSPMVFASKVLLQIFEPHELIGHYVCSKVVSKSVKHKKPLLDERVMYIKWLIEQYYNNNTEELWQLCRRAINKTILHNERKGFKTELIDSNAHLVTVLSPPTSESTLYEDDDEVELEGINKDKLENETLLSYTNEYDIKLLNENEIIDVRNTTCSPMVFATRLLLKLFATHELHGHCVLNKWYETDTDDREHLTRRRRRYKRLPLDENRVKYIRFLVEKYFKIFNAINVKCEMIWKSCCKAINRSIRKVELDNNESQFEDLQKLAHAASTEYN